jgi:DNA polymerase III delta subunit
VAEAHPAAPAAYIWGDDALGLRREAEHFAATVSAPDPPVIWRATTATNGTSNATDALLDELTVHLGTGSLFGGGTVALVTDPLSLLRGRAHQERLLAILGAIAPGNAVAFTELTGSGAREPAAASAPVRRAIQEAGGLVRRVAAPRASQMTEWIGSRAAEIGVRMDRDAAHLLAERVGATVKERDIDWRYQTEVAESELQLLALYRPDGPVRRADVEALVTEESPPSKWAFADAIGDRQGRRAAKLAAQLVAEGAALPVIVTLMHRRLRELLEIRERVADGATPADLVRLMRLHPGRAPFLVRQARSWQPQELVAALDGLLEVDLASKGTAVDGRSTAAGMSGELALGLWLAAHVPP